jgi:ATPase subunit of ABC transporter with duplicated ATPase domains
MRWPRARRRDAAGAALLIEMSYRLATQRELGTVLKLRRAADRCVDAVAVDRRRRARDRRLRSRSARRALVSRAWRRRRARRAACACCGHDWTTALALELSDVHKRFGATPIVRGVSLAIRSGERHALIGPTGRASRRCSTSSAAASRRRRARSACTGARSPARGRSRSTGSACRAASR